MESSVLATIGNKTLLDGDSLSRPPKKKADKAADGSKSTKSSSWFSRLINRKEKTVQEDVSSKGITRDSRQDSRKVTKRIIRRTIRTVDGGTPVVTESVEEVPLDSDDDVEKVVKEGVPIVSRKIIRRVIRKTGGVDREVSKSVTYIKPDGTEHTEVVDLNGGGQRIRMSEELTRPRTSFSNWLRRSESTDRPPWH